MLLEARGVGYDVPAATLVDGVDLSLATGELLALCGPNGAGKSTLLALLAGDLRPSRGEVLLHGRPIDAYRARELALRRAVLPQQTVLQFAFTAEEVVELGRSPYRNRFGGPTPNDIRAVRESMVATECVELVERTFPSLSVGEQARVALARVLAQETEILLLDEPTAALDIRHQELVMRLARGFVHEGKTIVAVVHDLNLAAAHADRIALLDEGSLVACGPAWDVLSEATLRRVFEHDIYVFPHPLTKRPLVVTAPEDARANARGRPCAGLRSR